MNKPSSDEPRREHHSHTQSRHPFRSPHSRQAPVSPPFGEPTVPLDLPHQSSSGEEFAPRQHQRGAFAPQAATRHRNPHLTEHQQPDSQLQPELLVQRHESQQRYGAHHFPNADPLEIDVQPAARVTDRPARAWGSLLGIVSCLLILTLALGSVVGLRNQEIVRLAVAIVDWDAVEQRARSASRDALDVVSDQPNFADVPGAAVYPVCDETSSSEIDSLMNALNLMRRTDEGLRLFDQLVDYGVCVGVENIPYNSGYAYAHQSGLTGGWQRSYIMVDDDLLESGEDDVVAALLIHEATHMDRYIRGIACTYAQTCTTLANGVELDEEIAAHGAEAEWWIAAYGDDGKRFAFGFDYGVNQLAGAYLEGSEAFASYVRGIRSDEREGGW